MPIEFPTSPNEGDTYTYNGKVWAWDGQSWVGVRLETGTPVKKIWSESVLTNPYRSRKLNSGYSFNTDQRRTQAGTISAAKHYMERSLGNFGIYTWTPAQISTELWLDADDSSTIILNGSTVSQWNDKSGNGRDILQAVASQQPAWNATGLNGKPTLVFDGINDILLNQNAGSVGVTNITFIAVMRYVSASGEDLPIGVGRTVDSRSMRSIYRANGGTSLGFATWSSDVPSSSLSTDTGGDHHIFETVMINSTSVNLYRDGVIDTGAPRNLNSSPALPVAFNGFSIGSLQGSAVGNYYSNIEVSEVIVLYTNISDTDRQKIEGYLAHKWGLTNNLPADHPYKSAAP